MQITQPGIIWILKSCFFCFFNLVVCVWFVGPDEVSWDEWINLIHQLSSELVKQQLSRGEICVANLIPPANGASQGNYFLPKSRMSLLAWHSKCAVDLDILKYFKIF